MNKCRRCGTRFDPAFSMSKVLCGDCLEIVQGRFLVDEFLVGKRFLDYLSGYQREVLATSDRGDDNYEVSVPNQEHTHEVVHGDFIRECLERAGER